MIHYTNASSYVIIPKPHFSSCEGINSLCRRFDVLFFAVLAQSVPTMTAVVAAHVVAGPAGRCRSINRDRCYRPFLARPPRSLVLSIDICAGLGLCDSFWVFFAYKENDRPN